MPVRWWQTIAAKETGKCSTCSIKGWQLAFLRAGQYLHYSLYAGIYRQILVAMATMQWGNHQSTTLYQDISTHTRTWSERAQKTHSMHTRTWSERAQKMHTMHSSSCTWSRTKQELYEDTYCTYTHALVWTRFLRMKEKLQEHTHYTTASVCMKRRFSE